jgi:hypothetical protein
MLRKEKALGFRQRLFCFVGKTGFEPATPWSQTRCATGLRYFPKLGAPPLAGLLPEYFLLPGAPLTEANSRQKDGKNSPKRLNSKTNPDLL